MALSGAVTRTLAGVLTEGLPTGATGGRTSSLSTSDLMLPAYDSMNLRWSAWPFGLSWNAVSSNRTLP